MLRAVVGIVGVLTALFPDRTIDFFETIVVDNPGAAQRRARATTGVRAEGIAITVASLLGGRPYAWMMNLTGIAGAVVASSPGVYRSSAARLLFVDPAEVEWKEGFAARVRIIGAIDVALAARAFGKRRAASRRAVREAAADRERTTTDGTRRRRLLSVR